MAGSIRTGQADAVSYTHLDVYKRQQVRLPRILLCTLTGLALGLSGCVMQSLMRNPLASPYTLGVSNGAAFGAALAMLWGGGTLGAGFSFLGYSAVAMNAFVFGCLSLAIVCAASKLCGGNLSVLILTGSAIGSLFSAGISILKYLSSAEALKNLDIWLMGGFWASNWKSVLTVLPFCLLSLLFTCLLYTSGWRSTGGKAEDEK